MKIACLGNMNNSMFAIQRYLLDNGHDANLILFGDEDHFKPEADTFDITSYLNKIKYVEWLKKDLLSFDKQEVKSELKKYDFVIASGNIMSYLNACNIIVDLFIPYGSDLYELPFPRKESSESSYYKMLEEVEISKQRKSIETSAAILWDYTNDDFEKIFDKLKLKGKRIKLPSPFIYVGEFNEMNFDHLKKMSVFSKRMEDIRKNFDLIIFNHSRQCWKNPPDQWSYKGNDVILKAYSKFKRTSSLKSCLILFEYGPDVEHTKMLANELGIQEHIIWMPLMPRKEILTIINFADVGLGEIGHYSWFSYGAIYEFLSMKKPVIHFRNDKLYKDHYNTMYPMFSAKNEQELIDHLSEYEKNPTYFKEVGVNAYNWFKENAINKPIKAILDQIAESGKLNYKLNKAILSIVN